MNPEIPLIELKIGLRQHPKQDRLKVIADILATDAKEEGHSIPDFSYRGPHETHYFNSDLSKWISKNCTMGMTCMDLDTITYQRSKQRCHLIEVKHFAEQREPFKFGQRELLTEMARALKTSTSDVFFGVYVAEIKLVDGDIKIARITDIANGDVGETKEQSLFKSFFECEISFDTFLNSCMLT